MPGNVRKPKEATNISIEYTCIACGWSEKRDSRNPDPPAYTHCPSCDSQELIPFHTHIPSTKSLPYCPAIPVEEGWR